MSKNPTDNNSHEAKTAELSVAELNQETKDKE
jgi:hypothetical protein